MAVIIDTPAESSPYGLGRQPAQVATRIDESTNMEFLKATLGDPQRFHYNSTSKLCVAHNDNRWGDNEAEYPVSSVSLGFQALHQAFATHTALSLRPETLWYFIIHEVAEYVRQNSAQCARLFTDTPESKQTIEVVDNSLRYDEPSNWGRAIRRFRDPLREKITDYTADLFLTSFSTSTLEDETALLVALMNAASPFYDYVMSTRCGIPQIRLEGEAADWSSLVFRTEMLARDFSGLSNYFNDLLPVLQTIAETASGTTPNQEFWRSIYKYGDGSGGPYVTGWITAFFAYIQTETDRKLKEECDWKSLVKEDWGGFKTNHFPSHISRVPFIWDYFGTKYPMALAAGVTNVDFDETFLTPKLGFAVVEV